ncbi:LysM peptidoglycan-binding domain-containing protein [Paenibacillus sp. OV219]|uniref:LysM peptidoglycan-binding domain-containing protein n=1 Tax=Paenibacillus sp. OV219 TaxID=1884377 RepID=UPI0008C9FEBD|nr:LysM peptidoglycan-binding domain-containing protein [Paenibacillus sp. OV219]SEM68197.1 morphogenetic protein associated with SpoVID [Paenibacillus sp. OV219]
MKIHIVKKGDTLYLIAQKYNVSLEEIIKLNPDITNPDQINIGMKVKVPTGSGHHGGQMDIMHQHVVQQGDTLWKLSKAWGVPLGDMIKANPQLKNPNVLLTGEIVNIPTPGSSGMMHDMSENSGKGTGHHMLSPTSVMHGVQGLMGKIPTGKKPTGQKPSTMPIPEVLPEAIEPAPAPEPVPTPLPAPVPVVEKKYPVYNAQQHVDLFKQYGVPATEVMSLYDMPKMPEAVSPASQGPMKHGYGFSNPTVVSPAMTGGYGNPTAVSPAMTGGYGMNPTAVSPAMTGGYGMNPTAVSPAMTGGYGNPTAVSPASIGGGYGMNPTAVSPAEEGPEWGPPMTLPWGAPSYGFNPSMVSPAEMGPQGGYGYGGFDPSMVSPAEMGPQGGYGYGGFDPSMVSPAEMGPHGGYGYDPSMVSPANVGPQGGYGYGYDPSMVSPANVGPHGGYGFDPSMVSPANVGPHGGYGYDPSMVSPANIGPQGGYGFDPSMVSPANVGPQGGYGYGYDPSMVSPANMGPQGGYGYGYDPSMVSPANMGPSGYTYMGNGQVSPIVAGATDKNCNCGCRDDEGPHIDEESIGFNEPKAKVARKKKPVIRTVRTAKPKRRGSYPWINR